MCRADRRFGQCKLLMSVCAAGSVCVCVCVHTSACVHVSVTLYTHMPQLSSKHLSGLEICLSRPAHTPLLGCVHVCVCACSDLQNKAGPGLCVPPDVTLLSSGTDPAAEVGRLTAPLLWVGERWLGEGTGWHPGNQQNIRQILACVPSVCFRRHCDRIRLDVKVAF